MKGELAALDAPWSANTIRLLLYGETRYVARDATGREYEAVATGRTADDLRQSAYEGGSPEQVLDATQLDLAIDRIDDPGVKAAMKLRAMHHPHELTDNDIDDMLAPYGEKRPAHQLIKRGIQLITHGEAMRAVEVDRRHPSTGPVCWRCLRTRVTLAGDDCGDTCRALKDNKARPQRQSIDNWSLDELVKSQHKGTVPGSEWIRKNEVPVGLTIHATE